MVCAAGALSTIQVYMVCAAGALSAIQVYMVCAAGALSTIQVYMVCAAGTLSAIQVYMVCAASALSTIQVYMVCAAGTLSTIQVKELCRRQLLAKTSAAVISSSSVSSGSPVAMSYTAAASPLMSPANIAPSPSDQRSPADDQLHRPIVESLRPMDTSSVRPSLATWHMPAVSSVNTGSDVNVNRSPRPASNSSDGSANQQFAVVSSAAVCNCQGSFFDYYYYY